MIARLLARLVTSPLAFLAAGALDAATAWGAWARAQARARLAARARAARRGRPQARRRSRGPDASDC